MKRFACHYLYISAESRYAKYVVELNEDGTLRTYFPLMEEISATQWIGGVIVLSPFTTLQRHNEESFETFLHRIVIKTDKALVYAWHIIGFDMKKNDFVADSRIIRL